LLVSDGRQGQGVEVKRRYLSTTEVKRRRGEGRIKADREKKVK